MSFSRQTSSLQWTVLLKLVILVWLPQSRRIVVTVVKYSHRYSKIVDTPIKLAQNFTWVLSRCVLVDFLSLLTSYLFVLPQWSKEVVSYSCSVPECVIFCESRTEVAWVDQWPVISVSDGDWYCFDHHFVCFSLGIGYLKKLWVDYCEIWGIESEKSYINFGK